ncbi:MAG: S-layer homology domain-containing protein [Oscillibacter sp.]|nr:S-layer homology domain-containing protein [Oscillibacter sp.]
MKKPPRVLSLVLALVLSVSLCAPALASGSSDAGPSISHNPSHEYSSYWAATTKFFLYANAKGGLTRVEAPGYDTTNQLRVEEYDRSFRFLSGKYITYDGLPVWGGFYAGENYNFIITGQNNPNESDSVEVIRVLKYSKDWQYLGKASVYGANTYKPFDAGTVSCAESNGILHILTCHEMYKSSDGKNHQASMQITIRESDMTVTETNCDGGFIGRVSHSFNQLIMVDSQGNFITANHGDAYPRAIEMEMLVDGGRRERPNTDIREADIRKDWNDGDRFGDVLTPEFPGKTGFNYTGAMLGGMAETTNGYLLAYTQEPSAALGDLYQVKLAYIAKKDIKLTVAGTGGGELSYFQVRQITNAKADLMNWDPNTDPDQGNPFVVPTSLSGGYIIWKSARGEISWTTYDASGQTGTIRTGSGKLSDCQPIYFNGKVVWYANRSDKLIFYTLDASGLTAIDAASGASTPSTSTPSTPSPFKDVADNHWALDYIRTCVEKGIVNGVGDGRFDPDGTVSYAQFVAMITRAFFNDEVQKVTDTTGKPWYYPNMQTAFSYKLDLFSNIRKYGGWPEVVVADTPINRYDMAAIARQTLLRYGTNPSNENPTYNPYENNSSIKDYDQFPQSNWYQLYRAEVPVCYYYGILTGMEDGCFHGEENMTRAQACVVLVRMMNLLSDKTRQAKQENPVVTIECRDRQTNQVLRYYRHLCNSDSTYLFPPTVIDGYTPEETRIEGTASSADSTVVVYYTPN